MKAGSQVVVPQEGHGVGGTVLLQPALRQSKEGCAQGGLGQRSGSEEPPRGAVRGGRQGVAPSPQPAQPLIASSSATAAWGLGAQDLENAQVQ